MSKNTLEYDLGLVYYNLGNVFCNWGENTWKTVVMCHLPKYENEIIEFICYTRDIRRGRGCLTNTMMMLYVLCMKGYTDVAIKVFDKLLPTDKTLRTQGCMKDYIQFMKYYSKRQGCVPDPNLPIIQYCVGRILDNLEKCGEDKNTMPKWIPREQNNTLRWLYHMLAVAWCSRHHRHLHLCTFKPPTKWAEMNEKSVTDCAFYMRNGVISKASKMDETQWLNKVCRLFRKHVSQLSSHLPIVEQKLCASESINPFDVTRGAKHKYMNALGNSFSNHSSTSQLNAFDCLTHYNNINQILVDKQYSLQLSYFTDDNLMTYTCVKPQTITRVDNKTAGQNMMIGVFIKKMMDLIFYKREITGKLDKIKYYCDVKNKLYSLDLEWEAMIVSWSIPILHNCLPLLDNSYSMCSEIQRGNTSPHLNIGHAYYVALGWACLIAKCSTYHRVLVMEERPKWIVFETQHRLSEQLELLITEAYGNTAVSYSNTLALLRDTMLAEEKDTGKITEQTFIVLSNFQFTTPTMLLHEYTKSVFSEITPYPHMVYWNVGNKWLDLPANEDEICVVMSGEASTLIHELKNALCYNKRTLIQHILASLEQHRHSIVLCDTQNEFICHSTTKL